MRFMVYGMVRISQHNMGYECLPIGIAELPLLRNNAYDLKIEIAKLRVC